MTLDPETLSLLLDATRRLVDEKLIPAEAEADANGELPSDVVRAMREMGLFGLTVPESYSGLGLNRSEEVRFLFEFCRASPSFRSLLGTTVGVGGKSILLDGTEEQKAYWLPRIARGETIVSFCLTEPDSGSDAKALKTRARRDGAEWVIDGTKRFISNAPLVGLFVVMARTGERVTAFLVPAETPGIEVAKPWRKMGQRAADVADVAFENCRVRADSVLGGEAGIGRGFNTAMKALDDGRLHIAAVAVGLGRRLIEEMLEYARTRRQFGEPIASFQLIQAMLADSEAELAAARALVETTAAKRDAGKPVTRDAASAKYFATEAVWRTADRAVQLHGGYGYMSDTPVERLFRDARLLRLFEGTSQIMQLVIAREMLRQA